MSKSKEFTVEPIGYIHSCYPEKFGIPRQSGLVDEAKASIHLHFPYNDREMIRDLDQFSHVWVQFLFHETMAEGWKRTIRPPGLGGQKRVGVYASRSPHRPNFIGLSVVRLLSIGVDKDHIALEVRGGDFLDLTPVLDIKPYIPYCDSVSEATGGYSGSFNSNLTIKFNEDTKRFCCEYEKATQRNLEGLIFQVLTQDPRPANQHGRKKIFGMQLWDVNVRWQCDGNIFTVIECVKVQRNIQANDYLHP